MQVCLTQDYALNTLSCHFLETFQVPTHSALILSLIQIPFLLWLPSIHHF